MQTLINACRQIVSVAVEIRTLPGIDFIKADSMYMRLFAVKEMLEKYKPPTERTAEFEEIMELDVEIQDEDAEDGNGLTTFNVYECGKCHWRFTGNMTRHGYGYTSESTDSANYCPACGAKSKEAL